MKKEESLLKVEGLKKYFEVKSGLFDKEIKCVKAVDGISFDLKKRRNFGYSWRIGMWKINCRKNHS